MAHMDWQRLALAVRNRRLTLDLGQADVAKRARLTVPTISRLENGHSVKVRTLWKLDRGLDWKPGSAEQVLAGADPVELPPAGEVYTDPAERHIWGLTELTETRRREWIADLRRAREDHAERSLEGEP